MSSSMMRLGSCRLHDGRAARVHFLPTHVIEEPLAPLVGADDAAERTVAPEARKTDGRIGRAAAARFLHLPHADFRAQREDKSLAACDSLHEVAIGAHEDVDGRSPDGQRPWTRGGCHDYC